MSKSKYLITKTSQIFPFTEIEEGLAPRGQGAPVVVDQRASLPDIGVRIVNTVSLVRVDLFIG